MPRLSAIRSIETHSLELALGSAAGDLPARQSQRYAMIGSITSPKTSVRRMSRPLQRKVTRL
jgi:hypothetical protein